jgi:hypothetical protein
MYVLVKLRGFILSYVKSNIINLDTLSASDDLSVYYQSGLFGDDTAFVRMGERVITVPLWLWAEWELPHGIQGIIDTWQGGLLKRYWPPGVVRMIEMGQAIADVEDDVFGRLHIMARALRRMMSGKYRDTLSQIEIEALALEQQYMFEAPGLAGKRSKFEWIAAKMSRGSDQYKANQIRDMLENASLTLRAAFEQEMVNKLAQTRRQLREVWIECAQDDKGEKTA